MHEVLRYLKPSEAQTYSEYISGRVSHMENGTHYWSRIAGHRDEISWRILQDHIKGEDSIRRLDHAVPFSDPTNLDTPMKVFYPDRNCLAELRYGGVHPPIEAVHEAKILLINSDGSGDVVASIERDQYSRNNDVVSQHVVDYRRCHDEILEPLDYEQAIDWCIKRAIPQCVWNGERNRSYFNIVPLSEIPTDRSNRMRWKLEDFLA